MFLDARAELEAQQEETLANAWAVCENSIATMKSPADASCSNENRPARSWRLEDQARPVDERVIEENRLIENGMRVDSNVEENRQRVSGNALIDAASVPLVYPPYELGRQGIPYELGGHGIPATIPGGIPSGVPPSVYLTPVDAMNLLYANRHAMNYSPKLFSLVESAYYTTPNRCVRVKAPSWSMEPTPNCSQYQNELTPSYEKSEADSGLGRSTEGASTPRYSPKASRNSRSQREELEDEQISTSHPSPKSIVASERSTAKHASFEDDKKVLVSGTSEDEPDKDEKIQMSSAKKREARRDNSES